MRMLAVEERVPVVRPLMTQGRVGHEAWVKHVFAAALSGLRRKARSRRIAQLVAVTDVYAWKLLRRDKGWTASRRSMPCASFVLAIHHNAEGD